MEAVRRFLEYLFREKRMQTVYASFFTGNDASRRVMEKCGMCYDHFSEKELTYLDVGRDMICMLTAAAQVLKPFRK